MASDLMLNFKVRTSDGGIVGQTSAEALPETAQGLILVPVEASTSAETHWWDGAALQARTKLTRSPVRAVVGAEQPLDVPADGWAALAGDEPTLGPRTFTALTPETATLTFTGKYAGTMPIEARSLADWRADFSTQIDVGAGELRRRFITVVPGQAETYLYKAAEARAWTANNASPTPMLSPEAQARGMTIPDLAAEVLANETAWLALGGRIEAARLGAKAAVEAATDPNAMAAAAAIDWLAVAAS